MVNFNPATVDILESHWSVSIILQYHCSFLKELSSRQRNPTRINYQQSLIAGQFAKSNWLFKLVHCRCFSSVLLLTINYSYAVCWITLIHSSRWNLRQWNSCCHRRAPIFWKSPSWRNNVLRRRTVMFFSSGRWYNHLEKTTSCLEMFHRFSRFYGMYV